MKHIGLFDNYNITSTTGNKVVAYFETTQGSKYLITDKGETKRWKSEHSNTGEEDKGLKEWYEHSFFVSPRFEYEANSIQFLVDKGFRCGMNIKNNNVTTYIVEDNKWRIANMKDAYPKSNIDKPIIFNMDSLTTGYNVVEYNLNPDGFSIKKYHFGSTVSEIITADKITDEDLKYFRK